MKSNDNLNLLKDAIRWLAIGGTPFPEADDLTLHAVAFARMMMAHAKFEAEFRELQGVISGDPSFGEQPWNQWAANNRANWMADLIKHKIGDIEEAKQISNLLGKVKKPTNDRNLLAHGHWWHLSPDKKVLKVRRGKRIKGQEMHVDWTVDQINSVAKSFDDLEAELNNIRREIERKYFPPPIVSVD
jgi:hypothetical protein